MPCMTCKFSTLPRDAKGSYVLNAPVRLCKHGPPTPILVPQGNGLRMVGAWPEVGLNDECWQFEDRNDAADLPGSMPVGAKGAS